MTEAIAILGGILGAIIGAITICSFIFYNKSQVDEKIANLQVQLFEKVLSTEHNVVQIKDTLEDKLNTNRQSFETAMCQFRDMIADIKESDKKLSIELITLINTVKDELRKDYTTRYDDIITLMGSKSDESDFIRLEQKFDRMAEVMTELKTVVEITNRNKELK